MRNRRAPRGRPQREAAPEHHFPLLHRHAAGIDIGARSHFVALPPGRDPEGRDVREFGTFTQDLRALADWLSRCGITTVAMESTGVYWIPIYDLLESQGLEVRLVDPRRLKHAPGRKTDVVDCQWLQQLHAFGLLTGSFRPPEEIGRLRSYMRHRDRLVQTASEAIQHMQKALTQMNLQLHHVVSDIGGQTGMAIIRAIVDGERDPAVLARARDRRCKCDAVTIAKALEGTWREEHLFQLRQAVEQFDFIHGQIQACDRVIEKHLQRFADAHPATAPRAVVKRGKAHRNAPQFSLHEPLRAMTGVDLTAIEGLEAHSVLKLISEIGVDMQPWSTAKHFGSWLGLAPGNKISGGKRLSGRTKPCANRAAAIFRMAAQSLYRSRSALGAFYRRLAARLDKPRAITATAYKLARLVYSMLKHGTAYVTRSQEDYEKQYQDRLLRHLQQKAKGLGFMLVKEANAPSPLPQALQV